MELKTYLQIIDRRKKLIISVFLVLMVVVVFVGMVFPKKYEATTSIRVIPPKIGGTNYVDFNLYYAARLMNTYISLVSGTVVQNQVMEQLNLSDMPPIDAEVIVDSELIKISVSHSDPVIAAKIVNTIAEILVEQENQTSEMANGVAEEVFQERLMSLESELVELEAEYEALWIPYAQNNAAIAALDRQISNDQSLYNILKDRYEVNLQLTDPDQPKLLALSTQLLSLDRQINLDLETLNTMNMQAAEDFIDIDFASAKVDQKVRAYDSLVSQYDQMQTIEAYQNTKQLMIISQAEPNLNVASPKKIWLYGIGFMLSIFLAVLAGFILDNLDDTVYASSEVEAVANVPLLGKVMANAHSEATVLDGKYRGTEDMQRLQMGLHHLSKENALNSLIISNLEPRNGKMPLSAKLAAQYARSDINTILIDANLRNPTMHKHFQKITNEVGLTSVLMGKTPLEKVIKNSGMPNLFVLPAGEALKNPALELSSEKMQEIIHELQSMFKMVVIDTAPVLYVSDADELLTYVDGVLLIVERGKSNRRDITSAVQYLEKLNAPVLGCVVNHAEVDHKQRLYQRKFEKKN